MSRVGVEGDPPLEVEVEQGPVEAHRRLAEDPPVHELGRADDRPEAHLGQDVALDVDAGRHLDQLQRPRGCGGTRSAR